MAKKAKVDEQEAERLALVEKCEGDEPYDKEAYIREIKFLKKQTAESIIEIGKRLLIIREKEPGHFMKTVEDEIGIPYKTAQRFMNAALKASRFPQIQISRLDRLSNVYTLLEAPEEDLIELNETGIMAGKTMDEFRAMSVKEMRATIRRQRAEQAAMVAAQVDSVINHNKALLEEIERLKVMVPNGPDASWASPALMDIAELFHRLEDRLSSFAFDPG